MTTQQIEYAKHLEQQRHNKATEELGTAQLNETVRYNTASLAETQRANLARENLTSQQNVINNAHYQRMDAEAARHNVASESIARSQVGLGYAQLSEAQRHNLMGERIAGQQLAEQSRHNVEMEAETALSHRNTETLSAEANASRALSAQSNFINAVTQQRITEARADEIASNIRVNDAKVRDLDNQRGNRTANTVINAVREGHSILSDLFNNSGGKSDEEKWLERMDRELRRQGR